MGRIDAYSMDVMQAYTTLSGRGYRLSPGVQLVKSGTFTQANARISTVAGTAFIDFGSSIAAYVGGNFRIDIYDSTSKLLRGWLKAAGTGETLGSNAYTGFNFTSGWGTNNGGLVVDADTFSSAGGSTDGVKKNSVHTTGVLYKSSVTGSVTAGQLRFLPATGVTSTYIAAGSGDVYRTSTSAGGGTGILYNPVTSTNDVSTLVSQPVSTPSATGATVISTMNGSTYNWDTITSGFNPNDSSGYTYYIYRY